MRHMSGRDGKSHRRKRVGVALQIAAMVMLLCTPHLPLLARALDAHARPGRCAMDHRICGCSPERIASRTCCCFRNMKAAEASVKQRCCQLRSHGSDDDTAASVKPATLPTQGHRCHEEAAPDHHTQAFATPRVCPLKGHGPDDQPNLDGNTPSASHRLRSLPCGMDPQMVSHVTSELKYLRSVRAPMPTLRPESYHPPLRGEGYLGPSLEPPVPPPNIIFSI